MDKINLTFILAFLLGSIIIAGLVLNIVGLVKIWLMAIISLIIIGLFYAFFIRKGIKIEKEELILAGVTVIVGVALALMSRYPFSDFWWYHTKNWFIANYLLDFGKFISWIPFWHFGYPLLVMYGPGSHILAVFFTRLLGINLFYGEVIINIASYVMLVLSLNLFLNRHISKKIAFLSSLLVAISPRLFNEVFIQGHYTNILALSFGLIGLNLLEQKDWKSIILFSVFMFLSLITHLSFFTILMLASILTFLLLRRFKDIKTIAKFALPIAISAFWLLPAVAESVYWHGTTQGPNPLVIYLLSFGPFILLIFYGMHIMRKEKMDYLLAFITSLFIISLIPLLLFPILPSTLTNLLQKIFVDTFKPTVTASILMILPITIAINHLIKNAKYKKIGMTFLLLFLIFCFFTNYVYLKQDAVGVIKFNDNYYRDNSYTKLYLANYNSIKKQMSSEEQAYNIDAIIGPEIFNVLVSSGPPAPSPRKNLELGKEGYTAYLRDNGVRVSLFRGKQDLDDYQLVDNLGFYEERLYGFSFDYIKGILRDGVLLDYIINPEDYPSKKEDRQLAIYWTRNAGKLIDDGLSDEKVTASVFGRQVDLSKKLSYEIGIDNITILTRNTQNNKLKIGFNYSPHWKALIDGNKSRIEKTELDAMSIDVPANAKKVELIWMYSIFDYLGIAISLLAIILIILYGSSSLGSRHKP